MRSPSARVLKNTVDYYAATAGQDADGGVQYTYPAYPTRARLACSAQPGPVEEVMDQGRLIQERRWAFLLGPPLAPGIRDKLVHTDSAGVVHTCFVHIEQDQAGRGSTYIVTAIERS
jgi:hypothetical protein